MDCPPKKMAVVERLPLVEFGCSYESAFSQSSDFLIKFQILSLLLFYKKIHHFDNLDGESSSLSIVRGM